MFSRFLLHCREVLSLDVENILNLHSSTLSSTEFCSIILSRSYHLVSSPFLLHYILLFLPLLSFLKAALW